MAIQVLDKIVAELIAAGEVIERPASIVKELVENAIDAGSTAVTVEIRRGGISYIRVSDNGSGIGCDDLPTAFLRHATSKVVSADDLNHIHTLGFRGEALASIAAVSRIEATSKLPNAPLGYCLRMQGDVTVSMEEAGCPDGTTIVVRDLFYNVPARLKFLKKDTTEGGVIAGMIDKLALSCPHVSFKLICDGKVKLLTSGNGELLNVIHTVFGREFATELVPVEYEYNGVKVFGYTSAAGCGRANRVMQHFFVNGRYVRSKTCAAAIDEGYKSVLMTGKYPFCVLNMQVNANEVDVNVHPAKIEVRFVNERTAFDAIFFAVKSATAAKDVLTAATKPVDTPMVFSNDTASEQTAIKPISAASAAILNPPADPPPPAPSQPQVDTKPYTAPKTTVASAAVAYRAEPETPAFSYITAQSLEKKFESRPIIKLERPDPQPQTVQPSVPQPLEYTPRVIGELFKTYILFEVGDSFVMLDKHAAHERILYERLKASVSLDERQVLLKPIAVSLSAEEYMAVAENPDVFEQMGFLLDEFGSNTMMIREAPLILAEYDLTAILLDVAAKLIAQRRDPSADLFEELLHSMACRAAVKANDTTFAAEMVSLVGRVLTDERIRHCPHGRPVATVLKRNEIEKRFGRIN